MEQVTRILAATFGVALLLNGNVNAAPKSKLQLADLRQTVSLSSAQISPDGTRVVVVTSRGDYEKDRNVGDLTIVNVKTRTSRMLVPGARAAQVEWSPDGKRVAYIAMPAADGEKPQPPQLFVLPMNGGAPVQLTDEKNGVDGFDWRPDGAAIAYVSTPESKNAKAIEHHEDAFNETGEAWTEQEPFAPHVLAEVLIAGGKPRTIGTVDSISGGIAYSPDGRAIYATVMEPDTNPSNERNHIVRIDRTNGQVTAIANATEASEPLRSPDGKYLAHLASYREFEPVNQVIVRDAGGSRVLWNTAHLDRGVQSVAFFPDDSLAVVADDRTNTRLFRVDAHGSRSLTNDDLNVRGEPSVARNGSVAFVAATADRPSELYLLPSNARHATRLTNINAWALRYAIGKHETIAWNSHGMRVFGVLVYPPDYDARAGGKKLPLVLYIHGGPTSASTTSFGMPDVLAAHGWIVFSPNYAGSDNESIAFADSIVPHVTSVAGPTIEDGVNAVLKQTNADPARIGVSGWSAGGMMTSWLITHDTRWKAAVDGAAVDDFLGLGYMSDSKGYLQSLIGSDPWTDPSRMTTYRDESPSTYADRVKTPTLILTDASDYRVPTPLSYEFYHAIRATGTPVKLVVWPVVGHFPSDPVRSEDVFRQWEAWFVAHL